MKVNESVRMLEYLIRCGFRVIQSNIIPQATCVFSSNGKTYKHTRDTHLVSNTKGEEVYYSTEETIEI